MPKPKQIRSGFFKFAEDHKYQISYETISEIKIAWYKLSEKQRTEYRKQAKIQKKGHAEAVKEWQKSKEYAKSMRAKKKKEKIGKKPKDKNKPKGSRNSMLFYGQTVRQEVKAYLGCNANLMDVQREITRRWTLLAEVEKLPFCKMHEKDKERYKEAMVEYRKTAEYKRFQKKVEHWELAQKMFKIEQELEQPPQKNQNKL